MTGTSLDAIDTAAVRITGRGLTARATFMGQASADFGSLADRLRRAQRQEPLTAGSFAALSRDLAIAHLPPLRELAHRHGHPDLVVVHGQTLFHHPPLSLQLINPSVIAHDLNCTVVSNLRAADLAAGGQGAPITPLADWMLFRARRTWRAIVNLGGFSNATIIPPEPSGETPRSRRESWATLVRGADLCLCNQLLDHLARTRSGVPFDHDGALARSGVVALGPSGALRALLDSQRLAGRSLGTSDEILERASETVSTLSPPDALATATEAIAVTIAIALKDHLAFKAPAERVRVIVAGGGARNRTLVGALARAVGAPVDPSVTLGIPDDARESVAMALLGALGLDGVAVTVPSITGRTKMSIGDGELVCARPRS